jgi:hypothetical protein
MTQQIVDCSCFECNSNCREEKISSEHARYLAHIASGFPNCDLLSVRYSILSIIRITNLGGVVDLKTIKLPIGVEGKFEIVALGTCFLS